MMWPFKNKHRHDFMRLVRLQNPRRDVWECACGERRIEYFTQLGNVLSVENALKSNSIENCLISNSNGRLHGSRLI